MTNEQKKDIKKEVMIEFMKTILNNESRFNDYLEDKDIFASIAKDGAKMADAIIAELSAK